VGLDAPQRTVKSFAHTRFKAVGETVDGATLAEGEFIALASVFGNVDRYGERIVKGAFTQTLEEWRAKGDPIPVIWQHQWSDPNAHIGIVLEAEETDEGLLYKGKIDIDENPLAAQVYRLMKGRRVTQQSFGFDVHEGVEVKEDDRWIFEIRRLSLWEVGPCLVGVNQATELREIKSRSLANGEGAQRPSDELAAGDGSSETPGSTPEESSASKGLSPASRLLADLNIQQFMTEE